jgi:hypothetical protein
VRFRAKASACNTRIPAESSHCGQQSVPGPFPSSEFWRLSVVFPLFTVLILGLRIFSIPTWIAAVVYLLVATVFGMIWLQLRMQLLAASNESVSSGRAHNQLAGIAFTIFVVSGRMMLWR